MTLLETLSWAALGLAALSSALVARNLFALRPPPVSDAASDAARAVHSGAATPGASSDGGVPPLTSSNGAKAAPEDTPSPDPSSGGAVERTRIVARGIDASIDTAAAEVRPGPVSVLIPARDEAAGIGAAIDAVLATRGVEIELVVLDDDSSDETAVIVAAAAERDARVRLERGAALPPGWCGKQHACSRLAALARHPTLLFVDADVRLEPDAVARAALALERSRAALLSGFPRQVVVTPLERLLIPLVHFLLLAYLPIDAMRRTRTVGFGAGCGQFMMVRRDAYERLGGHGAIRESLHDGIRLPRAFRAAGFATELIDLTALASCRMYHSAVEVWRGLRKNAVEGIAAPGVLGVMTLLLVGGQVAPFALAALALAGGATLADGGVLAEGGALARLLLACALVLLTRVALARRFRTPLSSALLHPVGVMTLLAIQWQARLRQRAGLSDRWKGRAYGVVSRHDAGG